jgi:predicted dehydrogenase
MPSLSPLTHDSHTPLALQAVAAGEHILIEKPMALTVEECRRIVAAVESSKSPPL